MKGNVDLANELKRKCADLEKQVEYDKSIAKETGKKRFREVERLNQQIIKSRTAERMLQESLERFSRLAENSPDMIYRMLLPDGSYQYVSPASENIFGYTPDEFYRSPLLIKNIIRPDWQDYFALEWKKLLSGELPPSYEYQIIHKSGETRWVHQRNVLVRDNSGAPIAIEGIVTDITERTHALEMVTQEKQTAQTYLDIAGVMFGALDLNGNIILMNKKGHQILGYQEGDLLGRNWFETCLPRTNQAEIKEVFKRQMSGEFKPLEFYENTILNNADEERVIAFHNTLLRDKTGITGVLFSGDDITDRKLAEDALRKNEQQLKVLYDKSPDLYASVSPKDASILRCNRTFLKDMGYSEEEVIGAQIFKMYHDDCMDKVHEAFRQFIETGSVKDAELILKRKDGSKIYVSLNVSSIKDEKGQTLYSMSCWRDISKSKQAEERRLELELQLYQKHKMEAVGFMAGGMAHNFNNNLSIILGNVELSQMKQAPGSEVIPLLENAKIAVRRSRDLVQKIITYSRQGVTHTAPTQLTTIIDETIDLLSSTLPTTITIKTNYGSDSGNELIKADPSQIQEVLINLFNNAIHAMDEKGELKLSLESVQLEEKNIPAQYDCQPGHYAKLSVKDSGCGMLAEILDKIFDPFFSTKEEYEGAGMGLSTVQGIVAQHGGIIKVNSILDQGTTFDLYFPLIEPTENVEPEAEKTHLLKGTERVLFVDDDEILATLGEQLLSTLGYQVSTETDSTEALKMFTAHADRFDLVITDQTMPNLTGTELIAEIKKVRVDILTILCTGHSNMIDEEKATDLGISAFMMKPLDLPVLSQTIRQVLDGGKEK